MHISLMALPNSSGSSGADKPNPSLIDLGTFFVDSDIIFGFTSHLLRRKAKVSECTLNNCNILKTYNVT